jgi:putative toxin-antitoxin system antitoxin component (TIGR02293 family)
MMAENAGAASRMYRRLPDYLDGVGQLGSEQELARRVEGGLPSEAIETLRRAGLTAAEIAALVLPPRTLAHRRAHGGRLSVEESGRAVRLGRILALAESVWGDRAEALAWLRKPTRRFEGRPPLELVRTEPGARAVEEMLYQVDDGIAA